MSIQISAALRILPLEDAIERILIDAPTLQARIAEMGAEIAKVYRGHDLLLISVLKGSIVFMADLIRAINIVTNPDKPARLTL